MTCHVINIVHTRDVQDVTGVLGNVAELPLLTWCPGIREVAQSKGERYVQSWKGWLSTWNLKCRAALKLARSYLSKVQKET